jgi:hypothetical protein
MKPDKKEKPAAKKSGWTQSWAKIFLVMGCILFVGVMIITSLGTSWLVTMKPAKTGDTAVVDITLKDELGRPVFTTNERIYTQAVKENQIIWLANPLTVTVNGTTINMVEPIQATLDGRETVYFAFLGPELNQITKNLIGMKEKGSKHIQFIENPQYRQPATEEDFAGMGGNFSTAMNNEQMIFGFTTSPLINTEDNSSAQYALRTVTLTNKTDQSVTIDYGYRTADITIIQLSSSN